MKTSKEVSNLRHHPISAEAAGELLDACKQAVDCLINYSMFTREGQHHSAEPWIEQLEKAIAKAEGRE